LRDGGVYYCNIENTTVNEQKGLELIDCKRRHENTERATTETDSADLSQSYRESETRRCKTTDSL
jgi:hypothetical protein